ncbi:MAG: T9SS type A sorting domain-containing protein [Lewinellaceae bacterium]|nr:T9SS type A sorting domain-containing protein [Lewinellaceae bacterium]
MKKTTFTLLLSFSCSWLVAQCPMGNIFFSTQEQIDSFQINYPGCVELPSEYVFISGANVNSLNGLLGIRSIAGNLVIGGGWDGSGGTWYSNLTLENLHGLDSLSFIGKDLQIWGNPKLKSLDGLEKLDSIGSLIFGIVVDETPFSNDKLESIEALSNLTKIGDNLYIAGNDLLHNLHGLENIASVGTLGLSYCSLDSLNGLSNLQVIRNGFYFDHNSTLENFNGLTNLQSIGGLFSGIFFVKDNFALKNFKGLENLEIFDSISPFSPRLEILRNQNLESLTGLDSFDLSQVEELYILSNPQLSICNIPPICEYLENGGSATISNNAPGCNSVAEIQAACMVSIEEAFDGKPAVLFSPNPASDNLQIQITNNEKWEISLYDLQGRQMFRQAVSGGEMIGMKDWPPGIYALRGGPTGGFLQGKLSSSN